MSKISSVYDAIHALVAAQLPNHYQLINPYEPELNDDLTYDAAWGIAIGGSIDPEIEMECRKYKDRQFILINTRKLRVGDRQRSSDAITAKRTKEKELLEDQFLLEKKLYQDTTIGGVCTQSKLESDQGLEYVKSERFDLIMFKSIITVRYFNDVTT